MTAFFRLSGAHGTCLRVCEVEKSLQKHAMCWPLLTSGDLQLQSVDRLLSIWLVGSSGIYLGPVDTELGTEEGYMFKAQGGQGSP